MNVADPNNLKLKKLVELIGCSEPVETKVVATNPEYRIGKCWFNAYHAALGELENVVHGWLFWEINGSIIGQHHAVVREKRQHTKMLDVTPNAGDHESVLFAESVDHKFDFERLKGWVSVLCDDENQISVKQLDINGDIINEGYERIGKTSLNPGQKELTEVRKLCGIAGSKS